MTTDITPVFKDYETFLKTNRYLDRMDIMD